MLLSKTFAVHVEPVRKPPSVVTSDQPFFDPGTSTSGLSSGVPVGGASSSLVQTTGDPAVLTNTQPVEAPSTRGPVTASRSATSPAEGPGTSGVIQQNVTQPVEAPGAGTVTQPVEAPGAGLKVLLTGTGSAALHAEITGSDSEEELQSEPGSPIDGNVQDCSPDLTRDESADQELYEESTYRETIRGMRSFMGWHQIPEFDSVSFADDNPFAGSQVQPTGKVSVKLPVDDWLFRKMEKLNLTVAEGYPSANTENAGRYGISLSNHQGRIDGTTCMLTRKTGRSTVCSWSPEPAKLNSVFGRVARRNLPTATPSRTLSQDILKHW